MPTISVRKDELFKKIGQEYSDEDFDEICFQFGIEIDEIVNEPSEDGKMNYTVYKIEVGANRYDLLCIEGLAQALRIFLEKSKYPNYKFLKGPSDFKINVEPDVHPIRPYVGIAILRNIRLTDENFASLIDFQEKLHHNICRKRTLVAIGMHDLDTIKLPLTYTAKNPKEIIFKPLTIDEELNAVEMFNRFEKSHLKEYLSILKDQPKYPIIIDSNGIILSLPPIINGQQTQIKLSTKNILIECTGTDRRRLEIVLLTICTLLSEHCENKYTIECGTVFSHTLNTTVITPDYQPRTEIVSADYLNSSIGIDCTRDQYLKLLQKMSLSVQPSSDHFNQILVTIPPTRQDILHICDIMEDAAIAYGYNNIKKVYPKQCTIGSEQLINRFCDKLRHLIVQCGFTETLSFVVCSLDDLSEKMYNHQIKNKTVKIDSNSEHNAVRSSLLPGLLKTLSNNRKLQLPIKIFEVGDIVEKRDISTSVGAVNCKKICALYCGKASGFELIKGLLDKIMAYLGFTFGRNSSDLFFFLDITEVQDSMFPERNAKIMIKNECVGTIGMIHPDVLKQFDLAYPCSSLEINAEKLLSYFSF